MVHVQKWDGKETTLVREVSGNALELVSTECFFCVHLWSVCIYMHTLYVYKKIYI